MTQADIAQIARILELYRRLNAENKKQALIFLESLTAAGDSPPAADGSPGSER